MDQCHYLMLMGNWNRALLYILLVSSSLMIISSENWLGLFFSLEFNTVTFLSLMWESNMKTTSTQAMMEYYLLQTASSLLLITTIILSVNHYNPIILLLFNLVVLFKLTLPPFYLWGYNISMMLSDFNLNLFLTVQKIPLIYLLTWSLFDSLTILSCCLIVTFMCIGYFYSYQAFLFLSSIIHSLWLILITTINWEMFVIYFLIYAMFMMSLLNSASWFELSWEQSVSNSLMFLALSGLPPFTLFIMKWLILTIMLEFSVILSGLILILSLSMIFYYWMMSSKLFVMVWSFPSTSNTLTFMPSSILSVSFMFMIMAYSMMF